jgi:hypothetical protein
LGSGLVTQIVALILAFVLCSPCADFIYNKFKVADKINAKVTLYIDDAVQSASESGAEYTQAINDGYNKFIDKTGFLKPFLSKLNTNTEVSEALQSTVEDTKANVIATICSACEQPIKKCIGFISFLVIFLVAAILLSSLIPILSKFIALIPVVGFLDKLLGFLAGAFNGAIISAVVVLIYYFVCASSCSTSIMNSVILKAFGLV